MYHVVGDPFLGQGGAPKLIAWIGWHEIQDRSAGWQGWYKVKVGRRMAGTKAKTGCTLE